MTSDVSRGERQNQLALWVSQFLSACVSVFLLHLQLQPWAFYVSAVAYAIGAYIAVRMPNTTTGEVSVSLVTGLWQASSWTVIRKRRVTFFWGLIVGLCSACAWRSQLSLASITETFYLHISLALLLTLLPIMGVFFATPRIIITLIVITSITYFCYPNVITRLIVLMPGIFARGAVTAKARSLLLCDLEDSRSVATCIFIFGAITRLIQSLSLMFY